MLAAVSAASARRGMAEGCTHCTALVESSSGSRRMYASNSPVVMPCSRMKAEVSPLAAKCAPSAPYTQYATGTPAPSRKA